jgi:hypothetical protein
LGLHPARKAESFRRWSVAAAVAAAVATARDAPQDHLILLYQQVLEFIEGALGAQLVLLFEGIAAARAGDQRIESPSGSGLLSNLAGQHVTQPAGAYAQFAPAYNRIYMAFSDLLRSAGKPALFNGTNLDPITMKPIGEPWRANTAYTNADLITPTTAPMPSSIAASWLAPRARVNRPSQPARAPPWPTGQSPGSRIRPSTPTPR